MGVALLAGYVPARGAAADVITGRANGVSEWSLTSTGRHADPFNELQLDAVFTTPQGRELRVPAFWAGGQTWKVRYASPVVGKHTFRTICSDATSNLHGLEGAVEIVPYAGDNPLYKHGPVRIADDKRHFEHADGTPFFWLGDTWWMGLCQRLNWPGEFKTLAADRKAKGFNVVQIVAGLYPDMHPFDPRGANEAGFPWEKDYARINPAYFDAADERLRHLVDEGFSPCIVGAWGYFLPWMGVEKTKQHWRYLVARYGAFPVVWCAAGEANLPWYLAKGFPYDDRKQVTGWTEVLRHIRAIDPWRRPLTIHPTGIGRLTARHATDDASLLDFDFLQTPHGEREAVPATVNTVRASYADTPVMPVINGEASYERLNDSIGTEWTRMMFWICMTNGAAGHTYGANGIWQVNRGGQPHGPSPHHPPGGVGYGKIPWDEAMHLPGSTQVGLGKKLMGEFAWHRFQPAPQWAAWATDPSADVLLGDWIWYPEGEPVTDAPIASRFFRASVELPAGVKIEQAVLRATADNHCTVWVNGREIGSHRDLRTLREFDVMGKLRPGRNVVAVRAENVYSDVPKNPAGFICGLSIVLAGGDRLVLASRSNWRAAQDAPTGWQEPDFDDKDWRNARAVAKYGEGPWGKFEDRQDAAFVPYATGIAGDVRVVYAPQPKPVMINALEPGVQYEASYFDPATGKRSAGPAFNPGANGSWRVPPPTELASQDWVLVMKRK